LKYQLVAISFIVFALCSKAQTDSRIVIGSIGDIQSRLLNVERKFRVCVPPMTGQVKK
jgi:hypothetical protein